MIELYGNVLQSVRFTPVHSTPQQPRIVGCKNVAESDADTESDSAPFDSTRAMDTRTENPNQRSSTDSPILFEPNAQEVFVPIKVQ